MLIEVLTRVFGARSFDATDVMIEAWEDRELAGAIDAEVPQVRYKGGRNGGEFKVRAIRAALRRSNRIAASRLGGGYWSFRLRVGARGARGTR